MNSSRENIWPDTLHIWLLWSSTTGNRKLWKRGQYMLGWMRTARYNNCSIVSDIFIRGQCSPVTSYAATGRKTKYQQWYLVDAYSQFAFTPSMRGFRLVVAHAKRTSHHFKSISGSKKEPRGNNDKKRHFCITFIQRCYCTTPQRSENWR